MGIVESWVAWCQGWQARTSRRAAAKLSGLDTALRRHQAECPVWDDTDEECSTCRTRRRRLQAAQHALSTAARTRRRGGARGAAAPRRQVSRRTARFCLVPA